MNKINLSQVKKCNQIWNDMPTSEKGKICNKCHNTIHDFRNFSSLEIALVHSKSKSKVCGLYNEEQLENNFQAKTIPKKRHTFKLSTMGLLLTSVIQSQIPAQQTDTTHVETYIDSEKIKEKNQNSSIDSLNKQKHSTDSLKIVRGIVKDSKGEFLPGCSVYIKEVNDAVISNFEGEFNIDVTDKLKQSDTLSLDFQYVGYGRKEVIITNSDFVNSNDRFLDINLEDNTEELTVFTVTVRRPIHKRIWYKIKNIFRKKDS